MQAKKFKPRSTLSIVLIVSVGVHALALVVFGAFKIVEITKPEPPNFQAPPIIEAPEMVQQPPSLQQRNQESAPPRPNPITVDSPNDVDLPSLDLDLRISNSSTYGRGSGGFGEGSGGMVSQMREMSMALTDFGYDSFVEGTLEGTLFDTKRSPDGEALIDFSELVSGRINSHLTPRMQEITRDFTAGSWNISQLERKYFSSQKKLYASYFMIPKGSASEAPASFGAADEIEAISILALYTGQFIPRESGMFRFVGKADDSLVVRANNRLVFDGSLNPNYSAFDQRDYDTRPAMFDTDREFNTGEWFKWTEGRPIDLDVMIAEAPGGVFFAYLLYQKEGENQLRVFSTKALTEGEKQHLRDLHPTVGRLLD